MELLDKGKIVLVQFRDSFEKEYTSSYYHYKNLLNLDIEKEQEVVVQTQYGHKIGKVVGFANKSRYDGKLSSIVDTIDVDSIDKKIKEEQEKEAKWEEVLELARKAKEKKQLRELAENDKELKKALEEFEYYEIRERGSQKV